MMFVGAAVLNLISDMDTTLAKLDRKTDEDTIIKLTQVNTILGSGLFGKRRKRSDESKTEHFLGTISVVLLS